MKKNVAIVGFGGMGGWHSEYILKSDVVNLAGIYDILEERLEYARQKGIRTYASLEDILRDPAVDIVLCATPNHVHPEIVIQALQAGKNTISEKPVCLNSSSLADMIAASEKSGKLFTVHQNRRWDGDFLVMKKIYDDGILGDIFNIESRVQGSHGIPGDWRAKKEYGGGMMLDWGVHLIDQAFQMIEEKAVRIYARMDHVTNYEVDDGFKMEILFESGKRYFVEVGTSNFITMPRWYMQGENGTAMMPGWKVPEGKIVCCENWKQENVIPVKTAAGLTKTMAPRDKDTVRTHDMQEIPSDVHDFYRNFCKAIDGEEPQLITHPQIMRVMKAMEAAFLSDRTGKPVDFEK